MNQDGNSWSEKNLPHMPGIIQRNFWRLLFSFLFAFLLFNLVHKNIEDDTEYHRITVNDVAIRVVPEMEDGETEPFKLVQLMENPKVDVTLSVPEYEKEVKSKDLYLECPVTKKQIDENDPVSFKVENLKFRRGIYFRDPKIHPPVLSLDLDYYVEKTVTVKPDFNTDDIMNGYSLEDVPIPVDGTSVKISGPKRVLAGITQLKTDKIPLENMTRDFTCSVKLILPVEARDSDVKVSPEEVEMAVKIKKNLLHTFDQIPLRVLTGTGGANQLIIAKINPEKVSVTVEEMPGNNSRQHQKTEELSDIIHAVLDLSKVTEAGEYSDVIRFWSDDDQFKVVRVEPRNATVTLVPAASQQ